MANNSVLLSGTIVDSVGIVNIQPVLITGATQPFSAQVNLTVASGANTITVPASARFVLLTPSNVTSSPFTLKGVSGDTGINISPTQPTFLSFDANNMPASIVLTSSTTAGTVLAQFG